MPRHIFLFDKLRKKISRLVKFKYSKKVTKFCEISNVDLTVTKGRLSHHLCVECFSQLSFDSEVYTKSTTAADFVYTSESNESCEKHSMQR